MSPDHTIESPVNSNNSEAIGALVRIACDFDRQKHQLKERSSRHEQDYTTATNALWAMPDLSADQRQFLRDRATFSFQQAHRLQVEALRLKQRYTLCKVGIDRLNSSTSAPAVAGES